jgi:TolA-binding protein
MALEMESEGAPEDKVRQIIDLLQKLERGLEDDQREDDAKLQNDKSDCEEFIDRLDDQLNQFKSRINELQLQIDENTSIKNIKVRSLEEK